MQLWNPGGKQDVEGAPHDQAVEEMEGKMARGNIQGEETWLSESLYRCTTVVPQRQGGWGTRRPHNNAPILGKEAEPGTDRASSERSRSAEVAGKRTARVLAACVSSLAAKTGCLQETVKETDHNNGISLESLVITNRRQWQLCCVLPTRKTESLSLLSVVPGVMGRMEEGQREEAPTGALWGRLDANDNVSSSQPAMMLTVQETGTAVSIPHQAPEETPAPARGLQGLLTPASDLGPSWNFPAALCAPWELSGMGGSQSGEGAAREHGEGVQSHRPEKSECGQRDVAGPRGAQGLGAAAAHPPAQPSRAFLLQMERSRQVERACSPGSSPPSPRKKTVYRSACLALALLVAVTVFQRSLTPRQFLQEPPPPTPGPQKASEHLVNPNSFWKNPKDVAVPTPMASRGPQAWDVTTTNCSANVNLTHQPWFQGLEPQFRQFLFYRHCRYFPMLLNHPEKCRDDVYLLVVVKSVITQHDRREAIRQTWGRERLSVGRGRGAMRTLFLLGTASKQEERTHYQQLLAYEDRLYGDILQWDFLDTFFNLTLKEIHFLKWLDIYCPHVPFIFKGDDDVFVNPTNLLEFLADRQPQENLFVGDVLQHARPIRRKDNKYYIPGVLYSKTSYPPYAGGGGFLMAGSLARRLHHACDTLELYPIDDVFLGMCLEVLGVQPTAHEGFKTFGISRNRNSRMNKEPCFFRSMLVVHKLMPPELLAMWGLVHSNLTCSRKLQVL
ncbi:UDP-GlcNAc:betaGal beta-1,3-N-acetylglucosaminyltransferase 7 [Carlito syrichta]|uniref:UDP-GlcNAc:betaGal beta-1,3-N-acetylglucosaminyltransferase 7 n=1 Tax=Carlito syrichta TaxID=1868482 RepID=A0A3Q0EAK5_CARSF|nr:UDP-GlcNAc:betaGal beta-1,3-N-acetylglucosaminyltransferase 7 [Carlito syrichta]